MKLRPVSITKSARRVSASATIGSGLLTLAVASFAVMPVIAANPEPRAVRATDASTLTFDVVGGRWNFVGRNVTLKEAAREIAAKAPVEIRIQDPELEATKLGIAFEGADGKQAMAFVLHSYNYSQFDDAKTGRSVYLVTSLATEVKPTPEARTAMAVVTPKQAAAVSTGSGRVAKSIDEFRTVEPPRFKSREQSQEGIEAEYRRAREETLLRAVDALKSKDVNSSVQQQALADLAASGDPRATAVLMDAWTKVQGQSAASPYVARSVWQNAAQLQFANNEANALLLSLASSQNSAVRDIAQAGKVDMERYRAAQNKP
jgi:hypothetical protein